MAKHFGAEVTAVCSEANADLAKSLGADFVIDYTTVDFTKSSEVYDVILDTVGVTSLSRSKRVLSQNGRHVFLVQGLTQILQALWTSLRPGKRLITGISGGNSKEDLLFVSGLIESGKIKPVIDRTYSLSDIVEAHRFVDTGRKRGSVVLAVLNPIAS